MHHLAILAAPHHAKQQEIELRRAVVRFIVQPPTPFKCAECSYDMTGLAVPGPCPECGKKVERRSFVDRPNPLPPWLRLAIALWAAGIVIVLVVFKGSANAGGTAYAFRHYGTALVWESGAIALVGLVLAVVAARRRRIEVATAILAAMVVYGAVLVALRLAY